MADESKTEEATPQKRKKAREEGMFARSRDAGPVAATLAGLGVLYGLGAEFCRQVKEFTYYCLREPFDLVRGDSQPLAIRVGMLLAMLVLPIALACALAAGSVSIYQAGWAPNFSQLMPDFTRMLNPLPRLQQLFKPKEFATQLGTSLGRVAVIAYATYGTVRASLPSLMRSSRVGLNEAVFEPLDIVLRISVRATVALGVLAVAEYFLNKMKIEKEIRMTKQEVKDEHKQNEGDARVKGQIRARGRERIKRALLKSIKQSDVVIANPTHISVALRYRPHEGAPVLLAKGYDDIALYIRELAREHDVPIVENKPVARAVAARVKVGRRVPVELYTAVAEVLAYVYRLKGKLPWEDEKRRQPASPR